MCLQRQRQKLSTKHSTTKQNNLQNQNTNQSKANQSAEIRESLAEPPDPCTENSCVTGVALRGGGSDPHWHWCQQLQGTLWTFTQVSLCPPLPLFLGKLIWRQQPLFEAWCYSQTHGLLHWPRRVQSFLNPQCKHPESLIASSNILLEVTAKQRCQYHRSTNATRDVTVCSFLSVLRFLTSTKRGILRTNCLS